jgi:RNA polymerase sigma factor (sigma-70 family)
MGVPIPIVERETLSVERPSAIEDDFDSFYRREHTRLYRSLLLIVGSRPGAEDVAHEAFVRVFERWDRVARMDAPRAYLYRIALNLHRNALRRAARRARRLLFDRGIEEDFSASATDRAAVLEFLRRLPAAQREALVLTDLIGMPSKEAAEALGIQPDAVRARVHRARAKAREEFAEDDRPA